MTAAASFTKHCPACGTSNATGAVFCEACGADISHIVSCPNPGADASLDAQRSAKVLPPSPAAARGETRICPQCRFHNPPFMMLCLSCGRGLDEVPARPDTTTVGLETRRQSPRPRLILQIGKSIHELRPGDTLGRDGSVAREYFAPIRTVSRRHVLIDWRDGHWVVTLADRTRNLTQLDGQEITRGQAHPLDGEHVLRMSTRCEVRLVVEPGTA